MIERWKKRNHSFWYGWPWNFKFHNENACLFCISYSVQYQLKEMYYSSQADFSQFTPIYVPKTPENAPAQILTQLRHWLTLEVLFELIKRYAIIRRITIVKHTFLYVAFAGDSTFFLNVLLSVENLINTLKVFSISSWLKANFSKCEIAGLGSLKRILETVCGLKLVNLTTDTVKILGVDFSYLSSLKVQNNLLDAVKSIQQVLRFWNSRMLSLKGRIRAS